MGVIQGYVNTIVDSVSFNPLCVYDVCAVSVPFHAMLSTKAHYMHDWYLQIFCAFRKISLVIWLFGSSCFLCARLYKYLNVTFHNKIHIQQEFRKSKLVVVFVESFRSEIFIFNVPGHLRGSITQTSNQTSYFPQTGQFILNCWISTPSNRYYFFSFYMQVPTVNILNCWISTPSNRYYFLPSSCRFQL